MLYLKPINLNKSKFHFFNIKYNTHVFYELENLLKSIYLILLIFIFLPLCADETKVKKIIKKTHTEVQSLLKNNTLSANKKRIKIIQAVMVGEKSLSALRRHYVLRHAFKEAKKIKLSLEAFKKIDFTKNNISDQEEKIEVTNKPKSIKSNSSKNPKSKRMKASYFLSLQKFNDFSPAEKVKIIQKHVKSDKDKLLKLTSDNYIIHTDYTAYELIYLTVQLEWIASIYNKVFNTDNKKLIKKPTLYLMKDSIKLEAIVKEKDIKFLESSYEYNSKFHFYYRSGRSISFKYYQRDIFKMLSYSYGKPFLRNYSSSILDAFKSLRLFASLESLQRESIFDYCMSYKQLREAKEMTKDFTAFSKKLSSKGLPSHSRDLISMFAVFLFYNGYFSDLNSFAAEDGGDFFKKGSTLPLLKDFEVFFKNEVPLSRDFNGNLLNNIKFPHNRYSDELENDDKLIIINAKYKKLDQAFLFKALHAFHSKKYDQVIPHIFKIKDAANKYPFIDSILSFSYYKMKNKEKALFHKKKALKICPNDPIINRRLKDLK
ncbi:MAG: hypothetical protein COA79_15630 [Planctomycetota bacterium]|nr:MAG: hypothetical protein COA79_15630 [Planctomycetota bacterium]